MNEYLVNQKAVSSGDHSFDARNDGKHVYCFSNEAWSASTKEVSFNVHGIVYVPESEAPSDPLEAEGVSYIPTCALCVSSRNTSLKVVVLVWRKQRSKIARQIFWLRRMTC